jgi:peroxiredoxin/predicted 2-oxoglutarate/Fe(II)-dependent dioxygenase YbiX
MLTESCGVMLSSGDPAPALSVRTSSNPRYALDSVAGRFVVLTFIGSTNIAGVRDYLHALYQDVALFDDINCCCFIVSNDARDEQAGALADRIPGIRVIWDSDFALGRAFGCASPSEPGQHQIHLTSFILDHGQRVCAVLPITNPATHFAELAATIRTLPGPEDAQTGWAPVLMIPNVIEPELCRRFIDHAESEGMEDSGFMQTDPATGQTVLSKDHAHKRRRDCNIEDEALRNALQARVLRRIAPQIQKAFQFRINRMERYIVSRYDADGGGWFRPHRDNTTLGTAHRRFAVTLALNDDFGGGGLRFPEFGARVYRPPLGGAIVFSCSLLHEALPVTSGRRYCILPFVYDDAAAQIRLENAKHLSDPELREAVVKSVLAPPGWFEKKPKNDAA